MNYPKILIWGVFLQWTFILLSTWVGLLEEKNMDDVNAEILNILSSTGLTHSQNMWLVLTSFSVLLFFVSSIGICFYKLWAKKLYIYSYFVSISSMLFMGRPFYTPPLESLFSNLSTLIIGGIIALLYFSPLSDEFLESN